MDCEENKQIKRPKITQLLLADFMENLPRRIRKRIEKSPQAAINWAWNYQKDRTIVTSENGERITLVGDVLQNAQQVTCSCLLTPRCYHVFACLTILCVVEDDRESVAQKLEAKATSEEDEVTIGEEQYDASVQAFDILSEILTSGCCNVGLILEAKLLRMIHKAKSVSLHRLAGNATYLYKQIQCLKQQQTHDVVAAMRESLLTAHVLMTKTTCAKKWIGIGRRSYREIDQRKLFGVFSIPIVSDNGYTGISTWFTDDESNLWSINSVQPGSSEEIYAYYHCAPDLGDLSLTHHHLSRSQIFIKNARASFDHRLSAHKNAKAVSGGTCSWDTSQVKKLWDIPLEKQLATLKEKQHNFLFFHAKVERITREHLYLEIVNDASYAQYKWRIYLPKIPDCLDAYKNNERLPLDQDVQCVARKEYDKITLIAVRFAAQHYNFSLDRLPHTSSSINEESSLSFTKPLNLYQRRVRGVVLCGVSSLTNDLDMRKEIFVLQKNMLKTAVVLMQDLSKTAQRPQRNAIGFRPDLDEKQFALSWLKLAMYEKFFQEKELFPRYSF